MLRWLAIPLLASSACYPVGPAIDGSASGCDESFEDHTAPLRPDRVVADDLVIITSLMAPEARTVRWLEPEFYELHDEWSWFRLLNNQAACGATTDPVDVGERFATIDAVYAWAAEQEELPLDLEFTTGGRLYSASFYALSLRTEPRVYAPGRIQRAERGFTWTLTFVDEPREAELIEMLDALEGALGEAVFWRTTSPGQEEIARALAASGSPIADRVLIGDAPPPDCGCAQLPSSAGPPLGLVVLIALARSTSRARTSASSSSAG